MWSARPTLSRTAQRAAAAAAAAGVGLARDDVDRSKQPRWFGVSPSIVAVGGDGMCRCDAAFGGTTSPFPLRNTRSHLRRRHTLIMMDETSTKAATLRSRYKVDWSNPLGEGAFGAVYACTDRRTGERLACKKIDKRFTDQDSFQREMDALVHVRQCGGHPHICSLRENFDEGGYYYLILDLVSGGEMFDHLIRNGPYSEADAARLVREVAGALAFLHGVECVHGDLKPENLMLSSSNMSDAAIKLVDFGCAEVHDAGFKMSFGGPDADGGGGGGGAPRSSSSSSSSSSSGGPGGNTPAYCPPEVFKKKGRPIQPSMDMWALGVILYIMLTGLHPFDLNGNATDDEIENRVRSHSPPPLRNSPITAHLSPSAIDLISKLMAWNPRRRLTAQRMLEHPWVRGETARTDKIADSDRKLSMFRVFKSSLQAKVFRDWCIGDAGSSSSPEATAKRTSLIEKSFQAFDTKRKGFLTTRDLKALSSEGGETKEPQPDAGGGGAEAAAAPLSLSGFSDLLSENMKNRYFPRGHVVYDEGDVGDHMYFINSGTIEVTTRDGSAARRGQGDFFGEGALLNPTKRRSATVTCATPVHAIEISREYFEKYMASGGEGLTFNLKEKDKARKRNRAKTILRLQKNLRQFDASKGQYLYREGEEGGALYILEDGVVDVTVQGKTVFTLRPGDLCGEHSLIMGRPRNTSAVCVSDECSVFEMKARDFDGLMDSSPGLRASLREMSLRRDFQKALVLKTGKPFPSVSDLREAFDAADSDGSGELSIEEVGQLLLLLDPTHTDAEIKEVITSLDLNESGMVGFEEFKHIFGMDEAREASI